MSTKIEHQYRKLIEASKTGDRRAQRALYDLYVDAMFHTSLRMVRSSADAEEIVQDAFVKAFIELASFEYKSTFGAWLKRIVINQSINFLKRKKIPISVDIDIPEQIQEEESNLSYQNISIETIQKGLTLLSAGYQQVLSLYLFEGYDHIEISEIIGISVSTSKSQYHRAKKKLAVILTERPWMN